VRLEKILEGTLEFSLESCEILKGVSFGVRVCLILKARGGSSCRSVSMTVSVSVRMMLF